MNVTVTCQKSDDDVPPIDRLNFVYAVKLNLVLTLGCGPWSKDLLQSVIENAANLLDADSGNAGVVESVELIDVVEE